MIRSIFTTGGRVVGLTLDGNAFRRNPTPTPTPGPDLSLAGTRRLVPPPRRPALAARQPARVPRSIGVVDAPLHTDALPIVVQASIARARSGRHRSMVQPGLVARVWRLIGGAR